MSGIPDAVIVVRLKAQVDDLAERNRQLSQYGAAELLNIQDNEMDEKDSLIRRLQEEKAALVEALKKLLKKYENCARSCGNGEWEIEESAKPFKTIIAKHEPCP